MPHFKHHVDDIMICKITDDWLHILWSEFLNSGAVSINFWTLEKNFIEDDLMNIEPGSLVIFVYDKGEHTYIIGGGFFFRWQTFSPSDAWYLYGVRNGVASYDDFIKAIHDKGGTEEDGIKSSIIDSIFLFAREVIFMLPDVVREHFMDHSYFFLGKDTPLASYLNKFVKLRRYEFIAKYGEDWRGIYSAASNRNSKDYQPSFRAMVFSAYNYKCAITHTSARLVLIAAHIQPFYDYSFQSATNGILLRSDIFRMFSHGYITAYYDDDVIKVRVSEGAKVAWASDYMQYDGILLNVPQDKSLWPKREYLQWHNKFCYEHWLRVGGTHV